MSDPFALQTARADDFAPHVGTEFELALEEESAPVCTLTLTDVSESSQAAGEGRVSFSLLLDGPPVPALPQGTYILTHAALGSFALFLVPVGADADRRTYQAVFN
jgi:hypothetical protein